MSLSSQHATSTRASSSPEPPGSGVDFYGAALIGPATIGTLATDPDRVTAVTAEVLEQDPDSYASYVADFVSAGLATPGWRYAGIVTVLAASAEVLRPQSYLEIGVRRGRSMSVVARRQRDCAIIGIDYWNVGYAGIDNPGPEHVRQQLRRVGHVGAVELISGDSHKLLPQLFRERPGLDFDLITVDGDHSARGARPICSTPLNACESRCPGVRRHQPPCPRGSPCCLESSCCVTQTVCYVVF